MNLHCSVALQFVINMIMLVNVLQFQNYAHKDPIIPELYSLKLQPIIPC